MTVGVSQVQSDLFLSPASLVAGRLGEGSVWELFGSQGHVLFADSLFVDLYSCRGRRGVAPRVVATVSVLQKLFGLSDREAQDAIRFDVRWKYACGVGLDFEGFDHSVLVTFRARLAASDRPRRIFDVTVDAARGAGLVGVRRVLDSTPLYDCVATMDTVTLIRSAIRGLLGCVGSELEVELRAVLLSGDDYLSASKPLIDWDDREARELLIDSRAKDGYACLVVFEGRVVGQRVSEALVLLASVLGQDLLEGDDNVFRIVRKVAKDRIISTVDSDTRHGHKTSARGFDGYKGHIAQDPDSEIITNTAVTPGNAGDASVAQNLIADLIEDLVEAKTDKLGTNTNTNTDTDTDTESEAAEVFGDSAYGTGEFQQHLTDNGIVSGCKTQPVSPRANGLFTKDRFVIDLETDTVTCPNNVTVHIGRYSDKRGIARFRSACKNCPFVASCTTNRKGRVVNVHANEELLTQARARNSDPQWRERYRQNRPKVERKLAHLMRKKHGGRNVRVRGQKKVDADFNLLAAAANFARLAKLKLATNPIIQPAT